MALFQQLVEEADIAWAFTYRDFTGKIVKILLMNLSEVRAGVTIFFNSYRGSILIFHHRLFSRSRVIL